ncbi:MAG: FadR family transcriptional regulator [Myxococcales bacterium]|jgi:DNA-binding FadR family transcriptional regulator|nr:FadR family transcriptional regulator [Myxococcales bacterium]
MARRVDPGAVEAQALPKKEEPTSQRSPVSQRWDAGVAGGVPQRTRAADFVFEKLAGAILRGELAVGSPLPPERELAETFDISRVLVREAIHRLKDLGLVRVRQGGQTIVLDPDDATDPRLIPLTIELAAPERNAFRDMAERQMLHAILLLELAEARMNTAQIDELDRVLDEYEKEGEEGTWRFMSSYWLIVAKATKNQFLWRETRFWFEVLGRRTGGNMPTVFDHATRLKLHRDIAAKLRRREGACARYLEAVRPVFLLFSQ